MICAAGVLICSTQGRVLLLQRSEAGDMPGLWCIPGGKCESGESTLEAAIRETVEETGYKPPKTRCEKWAQRVACDNGIDPVDFTTYCIKDIEEFTPTLNPEHVAFCWCDPAKPPQGMHPGCLVALQKLSPTWNELHVAKAVRDGQLVSPQRYENITFFDMRVTGTGEAFRSMKRDDKGDVLYEEEYVWRDPKMYLNPEFLERCNGVPVILEHPDTSILNTEEYRTRTIGALTLPYIKGEDVWAIARVQDDAAAKIMSEEQLSTSPAVSWSDPDANIAGKLKDGSNFLIEGNPTLLDHLAVCWQGVWDKDGGPTGINIVRSDSMDKADLDKLIAQNETITKALAGIGTGFETLNKRLDSVETNFATHRKEVIQTRIDSFKFSKRKDKESERSYQSRHDDEEKVLRADIMKISTGEDAREKASDAARKARRDAEEKEEEERRDAKADESKADESKKDEKEEDKEAKKDAMPPQFKKDEDDKRKDEDERNDAKRKDEDDKDKKADEMKADESKKDERKDDDRKDGRSDSVEELKRQVAMIHAGMKPLSDEDLVKAGKLSKRADSIYTALGKSVPRLMPGESLVDYHRKLAADLKQHTKYKDSELAVIAADSATFDIVTEDIFRQAEEFAMSPARYKPGEMVQRVERMDSGHTRYTYEGTASWMRQFAGPVQNHCKRFLTKEDK